MDSDNRQKIIVLTGCSSGLGRALVPEFTNWGHYVAGCSRNESAMNEIATEHSDLCSFTAVDVCDDQAVAQWVRQIERDIGTPNLLINNAAVINHPAPLWEIGHDEFRQVMAINVVGVHTTIRHVLPAMIRRGSGMIINLSSGWGRSVSPHVGPYCASKFAIEGMTRALSEELPSGLATVALNPGVIDTPMLRKAWNEAASAFPDASQWAASAAPFMLNLAKTDNGASLTVPACG
ncbi:MAG: SDR family oxidoreductase [Granulosicoccus sp.]